MSGISEEELRGVFEKIDLDSSGSIDETELHTGMRMLGIRVSANSSRKVLKLVDADGSGSIEWDEFKDFFGRVSDADGIKMMLSKANQRFFEYKAKVEGDASFAKAFAIPPFGPNAKVLDTYHADQIEEVRWLSDTIFVTGSLDGDVKVWDKTKLGTFPKPVRTIKCESALYSMTASSDGAQVATGLDNGHVTAWNPVDGEALLTYQGQQLQGQNDPVFTCAFGRGDECLAAGSKSGHIVQYDVSRAEPGLRWAGHEGIVHSLQYDTSGSLLCSGSGDGTAKVFDIREVGSDRNGMVAQIEDAAASEKVFRVRWRGDRELLSCGDDYCVKRWDLRKLEDGPVGSYFGHTSPVRALEVSPDGRFFVSGTTTGGARLWLVDEHGVVAEQHQAAQDTYKAHACRRQELVDLIQAGEPQDTEELKREAALAEDTLVEVQRLKKLKHEYAQLECTQALLALDSPAMAVSSLAWRDLGNGDACLLCGAYDQRVRIFNLKADELYQPRKLPE